MRVMHMTHVNKILLNVKHVIDTRVMHMSDADMSLLIRQSCTWLMWVIHMSHISYVIESCHTYHMWYVPCHTYEWVMAHICECITHMSHIWYVWHDSWYMSDTLTYHIWYVWHDSCEWHTCHTYHMWFRGQGIFECVNVYVYMYMLCMCMYAYMCMYIHTYTYTHYMYMYTCLCYVCVYDMYAYMCMYIHTSICV